MDGNRPAARSDCVLYRRSSEFDNELPDVLEIVERHGDFPATCTLEIDLLVRGPEVVIPIARQARCPGLPPLSLDGFYGTGFSSLAYLKKFRSRH